MKRNYWPINLLFGFFSLCCGNYPLLDVDTNMRIVLVPHDVPVGTILYRLRASDSDLNFPLTFEVLGSVGKTLLSLEFLGCSESESLCQADVVLNKPLDLGRTYEFSLRVTDTTGDFTRVKAAITATEGTGTVQSMFGPKILRIPENSAVGAQLSNFVVVKNELNSRTVLLEMRETGGRIELKQRLLSNNRTEGTLYLKKLLDFESEPWFTFQLLAMNGHTNTSVDTRNVFVSEVIVAVEDVQDTPPHFTAGNTSSFVQLLSTINPGTVVARVSAVDGDKENKRLISYGFLTESNPFVSFFDLDSMSGEIRLKRNVSELAAIAKPNEAIRLSVLAHEIIPSGSARSFGDATTAVTNISFWLEKRGAQRAPIFSSDKYVGFINENSLIGTAVTFPRDNKVWVDNPSDMVELRLFSLGAGRLPFDVYPHEGRGNFTFDILVKESGLLDFETHQFLNLKLKASTTSGLTTEVFLDVNLRDENDNVPVWSEKEYHAEIGENTLTGTTVLQMFASDKDSGKYGEIVYSSVAGSGDAFRVDPLTGAIIVHNSSLLDRELQSEIRIYVDAKDGGLTETGDLRHIATGVAIIQLTDKNDEAPNFDKTHYQVILTPEQDALKWPLQLKAQDLDADGHPNSQVKYQIVDRDPQFTIDGNSGEVRLRSRFRHSHLDSESPYLGSFKVKAYDLGTPQMSSETTVQIFSEDVMQQDVQFLFPSNPDAIRKERIKIEQMLSSLTGGHVQILDVEPYESRGRPAPISETHKTSRNSWPEAKTITKKNSNEDAAGSSSDQSVVHVTVHSPLSNRPRVVDLGSLRDFMGTEGMRSTPTPTPSKGEIEVSKGESRGLFWILIALIILLLVLFIIFLCCIFCPCCWLHRSGSSRQKTEKVERIEEKEVSRFAGRSRRVLPVESGNVDYEPNYRQAWSGEEPQPQWRPPMYHQQNRERKPRNMPNLQQRSDAGVEEWEFVEHGMPPQGQQRRDMRSDEMGQRWQFMQQQNPNPQQRRHVGYVGHPHPGDEGFVRHNSDQEQYERDSNPTRHNFGYLTSEMDTRLNRARRSQQIHSERSPSRSLPPATTDFRQHVENKQPNTRFFRTEMGEVLQFDFDGDEGKEMLMRRFIDEQKAQSGEREDNLLSGKESRLYERRPDTPTHAFQRRRAQDGQRGQDGAERGSAAFTAGLYHSEQEVSSERPKAALVSKRPPNPPRQEILFDSEIPELEEDEIEEIPIPGAVRGTRKMNLHESEAPSNASVHRHRRKDRSDKKALKQQAKRSSSGGSNDSLPKSKSNSRSKSPLEVSGSTGRRSVSKSHSRSHSPPPKPVKTKKIKEVESRASPSPSNQNVFLQDNNNDLNLGREESVDHRTSPRVNNVPVTLFPDSAEPSNGVKNQKLKIYDNLNQSISSIQVQNVKNDESAGREEDEDSGIGLVGVANKRSKMLEKKSVFTIAYDDMASQNVLRPDTALNIDTDLQRV